MKSILSSQNHIVSKIACCLLAASVWLPTCDVIVPGFAQTDEPVYKVSMETIVGETVSGVLDSISTQGVVKFQDGRSWEMSQLLVLSTSRDQSGTALGVPRVTLVDGGEMAIEGVAFAGENLSVTGSPIRSELPLEIVRGVQWKSDQAVEVAIQNPRTDRDRVIVMGEEQPVTLDGIVESFETERLVINYEGQSRSIQMDKVLGVVFADLQQGSRTAPSVKAILADGSRLVGQVHEWRDGQLVLSVRGQLLKVDDMALVRLEIRSDRLQYISDIEDLEVESKPIFAPPRRWQRDRSIEGNPLRLLMADGNVHVFRKGLGVAAFSRITFRNSGEFNQLLGTVGIDAETEGRGHCRMLIRGDGITLLDRVLLGTQPAESFELNISGVSRIELIVEPGEQFDLSDHVSWANLRMLKND